MDFKERPFAVVDLETTGDDELRHEILEIGLLIVRQSDWSVIDSGNWLIKPHHMETAHLPSLKETATTSGTGEMRKNFLMLCLYFRRRQKMRFLHPSM